MIAPERIDRGRDMGRGLVKLQGVELGEEGHEMIVDRLQLSPIAFGQRLVGAHRLPLLASRRI
jgi:hypothetical protein